MRVLRNVDIATQTYSIDATLVFRVFVSTKDSRARPSIADVLKQSMVVRINGKHCHVATNGHLEIKDMKEEVSFDSRCSCYSICSRRWSDWAPETTLMIHRRALSTAVAHLDSLLYFV